MTYITPRDVIKSGITRTDCDVIRLLFTEVIKENDYFGNKIQKCLVL